MPTRDNNIIKYNHGEKYMKVPFIIYYIRGFRMFTRKNEHLYK